MTDRDPLERLIGIVGMRRHEKATGLYGHSAQGRRKFVAKLSTQPLSAERNQTGGPSA